MRHWRGEGLGRRVHLGGAAVYAAPPRSSETASRADATGLSSWTRAAIAALGESRRGASSRSLEALPAGFACGLRVSPLAEP